MTFNNCKDLICLDLNRLSYKNRMDFFRFLITNASFKITFWMRIGNWLSKNKGLFYRFFYIIVKVIHKHYQYKTGIQISINQEVEGGLFFPHFSCIVINGNSRIGKNCTIYQGVTIGSVRGVKGGNPQIGNNVVLFANCSVIGSVKIGNNVIIGANTIVTKDIPDDAVVVGNPGRIINYNGKSIVQQYL